MPHADIVNDWFRERLCCGAVAANTEAYNQVVGALPALIERLDGPAPEPVDTIVDTPTTKGKSKAPASSGDPA